MRGPAWLGVLGSAVMAQVVCAGELYREWAADPDGARAHVVRLLTGNLAESARIGVVAISTQSPYAIVFWPMPDESMAVGLSRMTSPAWRVVPTADGGSTVELIDEVKVSRQRRHLKHALSHEVLLLWRQGVERARKGAQSPARRDGVTHEFFAYPSSAESHEPEEGVAAAMVELAEALRDFVESGEEERLPGKIAQLKTTLTTPDGADAAGR